MQVKEQDGSGQADLLWTVLRVEKTIFKGMPSLPPLHEVIAFHLEPSACGTEK